MFVVEAEHREGLFSEVMLLVRRFMVVQILMVADIRGAGSSERKHGALHEHQHHQQQQPQFRPTPTEPSRGTCLRRHGVQQ